MSNLPLHLVPSPCYRPQLYRTMSDPILQVLQLLQCFCRHRQLGETERPVAISCHCRYREYIESQLADHRKLSLVSHPPLDWILSLLRL
jgi:hypothetical protein